MGCNVLSICSIILSEKYLNSNSFETLLVFLTGLILSINAFYFLRNKKYFKIASLYQVMDIKKKLQMKVLFLALLYRDISSVNSILFNLKYAYGC
jgi:hypothetical protein